MNESYQLILGDCIKEMAKLEENSIDAIVCDPPYLINFMGKEFDNQHMNFEGENVGQKMYQWHLLWAKEALRVLKPGAHLVAFGATRSYHRMTCAIEDVGFEIRDTLCYMYGTGFPKSLNISRQIDKKAGEKREVVGKHYGSGMTKSNVVQGAQQRFVMEWDKVSDEAISKNAKKFDGYGTALKPAFEPIVLARKPLSEKTIVDNVLKHSTGGLNIDACRIGHDGEKLGVGVVSSAVDGWDRPWKHDSGKVAEAVERSTEAVAKAESLGRWPANVLLDEIAAVVLDGQVGALTSGKPQGMKKATNNIYGLYKNENVPVTGYGDSGGPSRFFYTSKASRKEREVGLDSLEIGERNTPMAGRGQAGLKCKKCEHWKNSGTPCICNEPEFEQSNFVSPDIKNSHPTVKPIDLMAWLCQLVTPPDGIILDCFMGSGSTGCAAAQIGFRFIGIEMDQEYLTIAKHRIEYWKARNSPTPNLDNNDSPVVPLNGNWFETNDS